MADFALPPLPLSHASRHARTVVHSRLPSLTYPLHSLNHPLHSRLLSSLNSHSHYSITHSHSLALARTHSHPFALTLSLSLSLPHSLSPSRTLTLSTRSLSTVSMPSHSLTLLTLCTLSHTLTLSSLSLSTLFIVHSLTRVAPSHTLHALSRSHALSHSLSLSSLSLTRVHRWRSAKATPRLASTRGRTTGRHSPRAKCTPDHRRPLTSTWAARKGSG
jgi:hypothetical protein